MHHHLPAQLDADVENITRVETIGDAVQNAHRAFVRFATAVLVIGFWEGGEVVCRLNDGV